MRQRLSRIRQDNSILDYVTGEIARLNQRLGPKDRVKFGEYLDSVRDIERRIQKAEEQNSKELPIVDQPMGIPADYAEHAKLMMDLLALSYQTDLTRISTFMLAKEVSEPASATATRTSTTTCRSRWWAARTWASKAGATCGMRRGRRWRTCTSRCWTGSVSRSRSSATAPAALTTSATRSSPPCRANAGAPAHRGPNDTRFITSSSQAFMRYGLQSGLTGRSEVTLIRSPPAFLMRKPLTSIRWPTWISGSG